MRRSQCLQGLEPERNKELQREEEEKVVQAPSLPSQILKSKDRSTSKISTI